MHDLVSNFIIFGSAFVQKEDTLLMQSLKLISITAVEQLHSDLPK